LLHDDWGTPCKIIPSSKCSRDYPKNVWILLLDDWGTPCEIIPSSRCLRDYPRNVQILLLDCGTPCEIISSNEAWETIQRMYNDMTWWLDCWMMMTADIYDWEICGWSKVVDYAGKICSWSEQWGMTTFKCMISALLIYMFETGA